MTVIILFCLIFGLTILAERFFKINKSLVFKYDYESNGQKFKVEVTLLKRRHISTKRRTLYITTITGQRLLPNLFLDSHYNDTFLYSAEYTYFNQSQKLSLEGDFNNYFQLYVPSGLERDALEIITPDVMLILKDLLKANDFYSYGQTMSIKSNYLGSNENYQKNLEQLLDKISRKNKNQGTDEKINYSKKILKMDTQNESVKIGSFVTSTKRLVFWGFMLVPSIIFSLFFFSISNNPGILNYFIGLFISLILGLVGVILLELDDRKIIKLSRYSKGY